MASPTWCRPPSCSPASPALPPSVASRAPRRPMSAPPPSSAPAGSSSSSRTGRAAPRSSTRSTASTASPTCSTVTSTGRTCRPTPASAGRWSDCAPSAPRAATPSCPPTSSHVDAPGRRGEFPAPAARSSPGAAPAPRARRRRARSDEYASTHLRRKWLQTACHVTISRDLDTRCSAILNSGVRAVVAFCFVVLASSTALAKPRVQVAPFTVHGETLGYFGPEVARAVTAALEGDGVETGLGAPDTISGRIDELPPERVRLSATLRNRTIVAEGPLEAIDAVATQLANKMAPLLLEDPAAQKLAEKRARDAEKRAASVPPSRP